MFSYLLTSNLIHLLTILSQSLVLTAGLHKRKILLKVNDLNTTALKNQTVIVKIARELSAATNKSEGLTPGNLNASVIMINRLADLRKSNIVSTNKLEIEVRFTNVRFKSIRSKHSQAVLKRNCLDQT